MTELFAGKTVLVAGGTGFVGVNVIDRLLASNARVRATIHVSPPVLVDPRIEYVEADLTLAHDCAAAMRGVEYVFMCAANTSGAAVMATTPLVHVTPNVVMNTLMLDAAYSAGVKKFLWLSSNTVYPAVEYPVKEHEMKPGDVFEKYFCVAWMKQFTEILCRMYAEKIPQPMKVVVVRPANIYGPYDDFDPATSHVLPALMKKVVDRMNPLEVWGDGNDVKDFIYIDDLVNGLFLSMEKIDSFDPINIGSGKETTVRQALSIMLECDGYDNANIVYNTSRPTMIPKRMLDVSKAEKVLGFKATTTMEEGIRKTMAWYRNNRT